GDKVKAEEIVEGMEHEHEDADEDHDHEEGEEHDHDHDHEEELDEHVWLSLNNTEAICDEIASQLVKLDPGNADLYNSNLNAYKEKLSDLDAQYKAAVDGASVKTLLFGDRFPFRYLTEDYGLSYYAAFAGCSAESEASFETIVFLADKTDELGLSAIMTIEGKDHRIAETVRDNTKNKDQQILTLDSMQATTSKDVEAGTTYYSIMSDNLEVLKEALK
ncbi:MAG: zinc ABC transporter substrate-binding protein, partial [Lachnospiraceae bacterium]|nr:zinc ABC transporter substrate-binding protein [Lachnospiraceae bacterium]